ncbi:U-box domain-containing protein kinase family protein [Rhynchospora pubera]|uniref:RING-type E3 ubiquitin transferase n=1 Tax=Rhynchospora pubera TaxID=906938 RepID=A0AAV8C7B0_9POAL|nr:U-box domain-containing protein kinase family protein [Rhynchospora pubera]
MDKLSFASLFSKKGTSKEEEKLNIKAEKKIYVALPGSWSNDGKNILSWVFNNFSKDTNIVLTHVLGPGLLVDEIDMEEAELKREEWREQAEKHLSDHLSRCSENEFEAEKLMHEDRKSVTNGLVEVTNLYGVSNLVMGAAWYSRGMTEVKTNTAKFVIQGARPSCQIWFICKGNLAFTRYNVVGRNYSTDNFPPRGLIPPMYLHCSIEGTRRSGDVIKQENLYRQEIKLVQSQQYLLQQENKKLRKEMDNAVKQEIKRVQSQLDLLQEENKKLRKERDIAVKQEILYKHEITRVQNQLDLLHEEYEKLYAEKDDAVKQEILYKQEIEIVQSRLYLLQEEHTKLQKERDNTVKEVEELRGSASRVSNVAFSEFSLSELQQSTENFNNTHKIGEGGFGSVYKDFLRNTVVAIKMLHPQSLQGRPEFEQEVTILSTVRHPNLVTLIGTCTEKSALIYEYLPNGSLEDRLSCYGGTPPLTWQMRTRIIGEICRALLFLHSNNPNPIVHEDLKASKHPPRCQLG